MRVQEVRDHVAAARERIDAGDTEGARHHLDLAAQELAPERLLTTSEAAELLGIREAGILKAMANHGQIAAQRVEGEVLIPLSEVTRLYDTQIMREFRASDRLYEAWSSYGGDDPLSEEELQAMRAHDIGTLPWQR